MIRFAKYAWFRFCLFVAVRLLNVARVALERADRAAIEAGRAPMPPAWRA